MEKTREELYLLKGKNTQKYVGYSEISKKYVYKS